MFIKLVKIDKNYRPSRELSLAALNNINLEIKKGEFIAIMGPSGSGKTTLLNIIGLLDQPSSGKYLLENKDISKISDKKAANLRNKKFGFVFQTFNLLPRTTTFQNVLLPLTYARNKIPNRRKKVMEALKAVSLENKRNSYPNQLSGGEQQRVAIARAIVNDPGVILADEPTGNLDTQSGNDILKILKILNQSGQTVILVTHNHELAEFSQRIVYIKDGSIVEDKNNKKQP